MKLTISKGRLVNLKVNFHYNEHGHPYATEITLFDYNLGYCVGRGYAQVRGGDSFSKLYGRKWALISLFKNTKNILTKEDRSFIFGQLCPKLCGVKKTETLGYSDDCMSSDLSKKIDKYGSWLDFVLAGAVFTLLASIIAAFIHFVLSL